MCVPDWRPANRVHDDADIASLLLDGPLRTPPPARRNEVIREDLLDLISRFDGRIVVVSAPAGYGKSTIAAQWCRREERPVIWLEADQGDGDGIDFANQLILALHALRPLDGNALDALWGPPHSARLLLLSTFLSRLADCGPSVIVIDDVHHLRSPESVALLRRLVESVNPASLLVLVGREDPDIRVPRLRATGDLLEVRADRLTMDAETAGRVLDQMGWSAPTSEVVQLVERTEGWPAGVGMVGSDSSGLKPVGGGSAWPGLDFSEYFIDEVLSTLATSTIEFVRRTAVFDRFCAEMCDAALGRVDSAEMIRQLVQSNAFVVPLDAAPGWYRYHQLFGDAVKAPPNRLGHKEQGQLKAAAARWHLDHGTSYEALDLAQASGDGELFGRVATQVAESLLDTGNMQSLRVVLERCSDDEIADNAALAVVAAHLYGRVGEMNRARMFLAAASTAKILDDYVPNSATRYRSLVAEARNSVWQDQVSGMLADGHAILEDEATHASLRWLTSGYRIVGCALLFQGRSEEAIEILERGLITSSARFDLANRRLLIGGYLICALLDEQRLDDAEARWHELRDHTSRFQPIVPPEAMPSYVAEAGVLLHRHDVEGTRRALVNAETLLLDDKALPLQRADLATRAAELAAALGDRTLRTSFVDIARTALISIIDAGTITTRLHIVQPVADPQSTGLDSLTPAELRVLSLLGTHRTLSDIGELLFVTRSTVKSHVSSIYSKLGVSGRGAAVDALEASGHIYPERSRY